MLHVAEEMDMTLSMLFKSLLFSAEDRKFTEREYRKNRRSSEGSYDVSKKRELNVWIENSTSFLEE